MSYLVLARRWRPQTFDEIRGQDHIVRALKNAISSGRIAHAYVFTGIRGVGKTSAARVLAKALNCDAGPTPTPCNTCEHCREITEGRHPDVLEIDGASNTGVEDVRRLREGVRYPPVRAKHRIYIIDEVHMLSTAAFNALLKTLEEPPDHVVFIFATTDAHKIPLTILSRCQQFDFKRLSPRELISLLADIGRQEKIEIDDRSLAALAREADGSVRDAQSLLDQVISYAGAGERAAEGSEAAPAGAPAAAAGSAAAAETSPLAIRYEDVRDVLGVVDRDCLMGVARAVVAKDPHAVLERLAEAERFGFDARRLALDLQELFRDLAVLKAVGDADALVGLTPEEVVEARLFLDDISWEEAHALFDILSRGVEALRSSSRPTVVLEMTLLKMAKLPPVLALSDVLAGLQGMSAGDAPARERPLPGDAAAAPDAKPDPARDAKRAFRTAMEGTGPKKDPTPVAAATPPPPSEGSGAPPGPAKSPSSVLGAQELWDRLLDSLEKPNRPFWSVLKTHGHLLSWDPESRLVVVGCDNAGDEFFLRSKLPVLAEALKAIAGPEARAELRWAGTERKSRNGSAETDRSRGLKREALEHPLVREALEIFEADVEEVKALKS